jgi:predicted GNAT superfamily acetyltransferase
LNAITIRPVTAEDRAGILRINARCRPAVAALDARELERLLHLCVAHRVAVAEDGAVVAYMLVFDGRCAYDGEEFLYFISRLKEPFMYFDQIAVDPDRSRAGVGRALYGSLLELARSQQIKCLCCEVNTTPPNPVSLDFHRTLGFSPVGNGDTLDGRRVAFLLRNV